MTKIYVWKAEWRCSSVGERTLCVCENLGSIPGIIKFLSVIRLCDNLFFIKQPLKNNFKHRKIDFVLKPEECKGFFHFYLYIYFSDSQKSIGGAIYWRSYGQAITSNCFRRCQDIALLL